MPNISDPETQLFESFYRAKVVANGFDPDDDADDEGRGRVRVRVLGIHSQNTEKKTPRVGDSIPDNECPWAEPASPLIGSFSKSKDFNEGLSMVPQKDSWVWVFFENGNFDKPVYFAGVVGDKDFDTTADNDTMIWKTKTGNKITVSDKEDEGYIKVETPGKNVFILDDTKDAEGISFTTKNGTVFKLYNKNKLIELFTSDGKGLEIDEDNAEVILNDNNDNKVTLDADGIIVEDAVNNNTITLDSSGVEVIDTNSNKITMDSSGIIVDDGSSTITMDGDVEIKRGTQIITMDATEVEIKNAGNTVTLGTSNVDINGNFTVSI